ncbi:hypothetical protein DFH09DRAFT_1487777 [Mycena vulgaris]|nr:hypothetical protein DFH09DRAFT_1487777 [Mycena vulgaris]
MLWVTSGNEPTPPPTISDIVLVGTPSAGLSKTNAVAEASNPAAVAPLWAQDILNAIATLHTAVATVHATVNDIRVDQLKLENFSLGDGRKFSFKILPFKNDPPGKPALQDPTLTPHNLPALRNLDDIKALNVAELAAYGAGYGIQLPHRIRQRQAAVARAIGYRGDEVF